MNKHIWRAPSNPTCALQWGIESQAERAAESCHHMYWSLTNLGAKCASDRHGLARMLLWRSWWAGTESEAFAGIKCPAPVAISSADPAVPSAETLADLFS